MTGAVIPPLLFFKIDRVSFFADLIDALTVVPTHSSFIRKECCFQQTHEREFPWNGLRCYEIFWSQSGAGNLLLQELNKFQ